MLTLKLKPLITLKDKTKGLIGKASPEPVLLKTRFGIHTFGLKFPIDILILDKKSKVVKLKENLPPNHIFFWNPIYNTVIELPVGTIKEEKINLNDKISLNLLSLR